MSDQLKAFEINCDKFTEKKNGLTYLSWSNAWGEFKKVHPEATYVIKKNDSGIPVFGNSSLGYMVYTEVTVGNVTHEMWLPVMNGANKPMKDEKYKITNKFGKETIVEAVNMFDINKTVMRCLTKNLAMFGLGINIYKGEDFPEEASDNNSDSNKQKPAQNKTTTSDKASEKQIGAINAILNKASNKDEWLKWIRESYLVEVAELGKKEASEVIKKLKGE